MGSSKPSLRRMVILPCCAAWPAGGIAAGCPRRGLLRLFVCPRGRGRIACLPSTPTAAMRNSSITSGRGLGLWQTSAAITAATLVDLGLNTTLVNFQFGPRFSWHKRRMVSPYAQALFGGAYARPPETWRWTRPSAGRRRGSPCSSAEESTFGSRTVSRSGRPRWITG